MTQAHLLSATLAHLRRRALVLAAVISGASIGQGALAADPVKLKLSSFESAQGNITANVLTPFAKDASAGSGATLQIDVFADGTLGGVVDMTLNNWGFVSDFKVDEVASQHLDIHLGAVAVGIVMRQDKYEALPPAARAAIDKASGEALVRKLGSAFDSQDAEVLARLKKSSRNTVIEPTAAEVAQWKAVIEPVNVSWRQAKPRNERMYKAFSEELARVRGAAKK
ncbi:MAG: hypothetical protein ABIW85_09220 [Variovorax sp.]